ncbi:MAG TPA: adenylyltransferase/cytidyltransferase family protein [Candidatus Babeliales bacterium]|nr:adenylyltransferase/cytidyltransferase family protein [Candidatus Babeliales bacterium]
MQNQQYIPAQKLLIPADKKIILVGGCFDVIHFGHLRFLEQAKEMGDYLVIALESDEHILHYKHRIPVHKQTERAYNLNAIRHVDNVIMLPFLHDFKDYLQLVQTIKPHIIAITNNDPQMINKQKQADVINAQLIIVTNIIEPFSSSTIIKNNFT